VIFRFFFCRLFFLVHGANSDAAKLHHSVQVLQWKRVRNLEQFSKNADDWDGERERIALRPRSEQAWAGSRFFAGGD
jgi:hypothetical protein